MFIHSELSFSFPPIPYQFICSFIIYTHLFSQGMRHVCSSFQNLHQKDVQAWQVSDTEGQKQQPLWSLMTRDNWQQVATDNKEMSPERQDSRDPAGEETHTYPSSSSKKKIYL